MVPIVLRPLILRAPKTGLTVDSRYNAIRMSQQIAVSFCLLKASSATVLQQPKSLENPIAAGGLASRLMERVSKDCGFRLAEAHLGLIWGQRAIWEGVL